MPFPTQNGRWIQRQAGHTGMPVKRVVQRKEQRAGPTDEVAIILVRLYPPQMPIKKDSGLARRQAEYSMPVASAAIGQRRWNDALRSSLAC